MFLLYNVNILDNLCFNIEINMQSAERLKIYNFYRDKYVANAFYSS